VSLCINLQAVDDEDEQEGSDEDDMDGREDDTLGAED
jgi:hypothetical protein